MNIYFIILKGYTTFKIYNRKVYKFRVSFLWQLLSKIHVDVF